MNDFGLPTKCLNKKVRLVYLQHFLWVPIAASFLFSPPLLAALGFMFFPRSENAVLYRNIQVELRTGWQHPAANPQQLQVLLPRRLGGLRPPRPPAEDISSVKPFRAAKTWATT